MSLKDVLNVSNAKEFLEKLEELKDTVEVNPENANGQPLEFGEDGEITFKPPFTKEDVRYDENGLEDSERACINCAHYIKGEDTGACHVVQGEIDPEAICFDQYAKAGVFVDSFDDEIFIPLILWGSLFDFDEDDRTEVLNRLYEIMKSRVAETDALNSEEVENDKEGESDNS